MPRSPVSGVAVRRRMDSGWPSRRWPWPRPCGLARCGRVRSNRTVQESRCGTSGPDDVGQGRGLPYKQDPLPASDRLRCGVGRRARPSVRSRVAGDACFLHTRPLISRQPVPAGNLPKMQSPKMQCVELFLTPTASCGSEIRWARKSSRICSPAPHHACNRLEIHPHMPRSLHRVQAQTRAGLGGR